MTDEKRPTGRPTDYTEETALEICERLCEGESLLQITRDPAMPNRRTVYRWLLTNEGFCHNYRRAREGFAEYHHDHMLDIADDGHNDWYLKNGVKCVDNEAVNRSKLRISTRQWIIERAAPRKYGPKPDGDEGGAGAAAQGTLPVATIEGQEKLDEPLK